MRSYNLDRVLIKGTVDRITPFLSGKEKKVEFFQVTLDTGDTLEAKRVVLATGPTREQMANIPPWVRAITESYPEDTLQHTVELMHLLSQHKSKGSHFMGKPGFNIPSLTLPHHFFCLKNHSIWDSILYYPRPTYCMP